METTQISIDGEQGTEINCETGANMSGVPGILSRAKGTPCLITYFFAKMKRTTKKEFISNCYLGSWNEK